MNNSKSPPKLISNLKHSLIWLVKAAVLMALFCIFIALMSYPFIHSLQSAFQKFDTNKLAITSIAEYISTFSAFTSFASIVISIFGLSATIIIISMQSEQLELQRTQFNKEKERYEIELENKNDDAQIERNRFMRTIKDERKRHEDLMAIERNRLIGDKIDKEKHEVHRLIDAFEFAIEKFSIRDVRLQTRNGYDGIWYCLDRLEERLNESTPYDDDSRSYWTSLFFHLSEVCQIAHMQVYFANRYDPRAKIYASFFVGRSYAKSVILISQTINAMSEALKIERLKLLVAPDTVDLLIKVLDEFNHEFAKFQSEETYH